MSSLIEKRILIPIYHEKPCVYFLSGAKKEYVEYMKKKGRELSIDDVGNGEVSHKDCKHFVYVEKETDIPVVAHEMVHLINFIYQEKSIDLDVRNDEPQAYLMKWLMRKWISVMK